MRYRDLKDERDAAIARAIEAERLSMKSEVDRIRAECEEEKAALRTERDAVEERLRIAVAHAEKISGQLVDLAQHLIGKVVLAEPPRRCIYCGRLSGEETYGCSDGCTFSSSTHVIAHVPHG